MNIQTFKKYIFVIVLSVLTACTSSNVLESQYAHPPINALIENIYAASDAGFSQTEFSNTLQQLSSMELEGQEALDAAPALAFAMALPRSDSYLAALTLLTLDPEEIAITIPLLIDNLRHQNATIRIYAAILLARVGNEASCSVAEIAALLSDADPFVRSAAALALEKITRHDLVAQEYEIDITSSFLADSISADTPEGSVVETAKKWWHEQGSNIDWHPSYGICDS